jgi:hypothetical protein
LRSNAKPAWTGWNRTQSGEGKSGILFDAEKSARIKTLINRMKGQHPGWSFDRCWTQLRSEQPGLFEEGE